MIKNKTFNLLDFQKQYDMNENETNVLMDVFDEHDLPHAHCIGTDHIMMKNPVVRNLKKFFMKDVNIKNVIANKT